jgi:hypothetical protein
MRSDRGCRPGMLLTLLATASPTMLAAISVFFAGCGQSPPTDPVDESFPAGFIVLCADVSGPTEPVEVVDESTGVATFTFSGTIVNFAQPKTQYRFYDCAVGDVAPLQEFTVRSSDGETDLFVALSVFGPAEGDLLPSFAPDFLGQQVEVFMRMERLRVGDRAIAVVAADGKLLLAAQTLVHDRLPANETGLAVTWGPPTGSRDQGDCGKRLQTSTLVTEAPIGATFDIPPNTEFALPSGIVFQSVSSWVRSHAVPWQCTDLIEPLAWAAWAPASLFR